MREWRQSGRVILVKTCLCTFGCLEIAQISHLSLRDMSYSYIARFLPIGFVGSRSMNLISTRAMPWRHIIRGEPASAREAEGVYDQFCSSLSRSDYVQGSMDAFSRKSHIEWALLRQSHLEGSLYSVPFSHQTIQGTEWRSSKSLSRRYRSSYFQWCALNSIAKTYIQVIEDERCIPELLSESSVRISPIFFDNTRPGILYRDNEVLGYPWAKRKNILNVIFEGNWSALESIVI